MPADQRRTLALSDRQPLGTSEVAVGPLVLGGSAIGGLFAPVSDAQAGDTLAAAWAAGVRAYDTAPHYGVGLSESRLGRELARHPRPQFVVSTKVGRLLCDTDEPTEGVDGFYGTPRRKRTVDFSRDGVLRSLEASLDRLGLDRVDVVYLHDPDDHWQQAVDQAYPALAQLRADGVIGAVGVGMNQTEMLSRFVAQTDLDVILVAGRYSLLDQRAAGELLPLCQERHVSVIVGGVFNSGLLADPRPGARFDYQPAGDALLRRALQIQEICGRHHTSVAAAALRFPLRHPAVDAVVVGARSRREILDDVAMLSHEIPDELWHDLERASAAAGTAG